ncbi:hypothetical protein R5R35_014588 [Gryllus longicercus]|uniref:Uncharacterized protein n=1 Tax=Gryllus longicercus TaxID=2509291 RepID=A0AAN9V4M5_9ORTH
MEWQTLSWSVLCERVRLTTATAIQRGAVGDVGLLADSRDNAEQIEIGPADELAARRGGAELDSLEAVAAAVDALYVLTGYEALFADAPQADITRRLAHKFSPVLTLDEWRDAAARVAGGARAALLHAESRLDIIIQAPGYAADEDG